MTLQSLLLATSIEVNRSSEVNYPIYFQSNHLPQRRVKTSKKSCNWSVTTPELELRIALQWTPSVLVQGTTMQYLGPVHKLPQILEKVLVEETKKKGCFGQ